MSKKKPFVIVGGGLAAASAVEGIRELDHDTPIILFGAESETPYDRPPLSKKLWFGNMKEEEIFLHPETFYRDASTDIRSGQRIVRISPDQKEVLSNTGETLSYEKLLIATGGKPRRLKVPGGELPGVSYYRTLADFRALKKRTGTGKSAVVIGGGFIGSEIAAALALNQVQVIMIFPGKYLVDRVFPEGLGRALTEAYVRHGVRILSEDQPVEIAKSGDRYSIRTRNGRTIQSDLVVAGIGINPATELAEGAGLKITNGIAADENLRTSDPNVYAAGDCCEFPYPALGKRLRVEHWDNAKAQGKQAGRNMAGAGERYEHMPFFFSDLFEFGYEAVGEADSSLDTVADWSEENKTGIIYYLKNGVIRGAMMCNVWEKVDWARDLIRRGVRYPDRALSKMA